MWDGGINGRRLAYGTLALILATSATAALSQTPSKQPPPPPPADTTTVVEKPDAVPPPPVGTPPSEPVTPATTKPNAPEQKTEHVPQDASGFHLSTLETKNLSLLYIDPAQTYLTPYLARAFENSLAFHEKNLHWKPWEPVTILLKDFSDYGNAAALGSPSDMVLLDVAPLSLSMEAFSPGERFFTLMNHELTHVGTIDVWNSRDAFWRHFLGGKPVPLQKHPESILYNFLTSPRNLSPRWYMEGSAVFMETWMAGGLGRAQGGYDEMVFRAKVRDHARFFSPLGLESEGTQTDFQVGANSYQYGTRFMSYIALTYGPQKLVEWLRRSEDSKAFYANQNYAYRDINAIDVDTGKKRRLLTDARIGDLAFDRADKSLWGIRHQNGFVTLVRIPPPYTSFNQIKTFRYGEIIFDLDVSPDGQLVSASYGTLDGKQSVRVWKRSDLEQGNADDPVATLALPPSVPEMFTFTPDGKALLGNSYYTGVSNVFRLDIASGKWDVLTNASTGFFRPQLRPDGTLLVYDYTGEGFNPSIIRPQVREDLGTIELLGTRVVNTWPVLKTWGVGSPAKVPLDQLITARGTYDPLRRMRFDAHYPIISGYGQKAAPGFYFHIADPLQFRQFSDSLSLSHY